MKTELIKEKYNKYNLEPSDVFKHQHYVIITRSGIDKIQALENIFIHYEVVKSESNFASVKAVAVKGDYKNGNCNTWYVLEMAEKRAMSRAVLKLTGFYELGVFGEDESEDFKKNN